MEEYLNFAIDIAKKAGEIMLKYFNSDEIESSYKEDRTIVTVADKEVNSYLIKRVREKYPNHSIDGEEEQFGESNYVWVCDPIDGTAMFARHIPVATFSLALVIDGVPNIGVVYDPFTNNMYTAIKGQGAYKNNKKIHVNDFKLDNIESLGNCGLRMGKDFDISNTILKLREKTRVVNIGSIVRASMCVASGDFVFSIFRGTTHKNCDIAAVKIIVEEAGGIVRNLFGEEQRYDTDIKGAIICNQVEYEELLDIVKNTVKIL